MSNVTYIDAYKEVQDEKTNRIFNGAKCEYDVCEENIKKEAEKIVDDSNELIKLKQRKVSTWITPVALLTLPSLMLTVYNLGNIIFTKINIGAMYTKHIVLFILALIAFLICIGMLIYGYSTLDSIRVLEKDMKEANKIIASYKKTENNILISYHKNGTCPVCRNRALINVLGEGKCTVCKHEFKI
jgi:superfamily I DNA and/or RNA helicase